MAPKYIGTRYAKRGGIHARPTLLWHAVAVSRAGQTNPVAQCGVEATQNRRGFREWYATADKVPEDGKACRKCTVPRCIQCRSEDIKVYKPYLCGPCYMAEYAE